MDHRTHFQNHNRCIFSKLECQLACALDLYVRTRRHHRHPVDHSQPPTMQMLNAILAEARLSIWHEAHRRGAPCNPMPPGAPLDAYCLVRNLRHSPSHRRWFEDVRNRPDVWAPRAIQMFDDWVYADSALAHRLRMDGILARYY